MEIRARNVNGAFSEVFWRLKTGGYPVEPSRNGPVLAFPEPVTTTYARPTERVLFHAGRDANPVFHLLEALWMLAGRRDVGFPQLFNSRIGQYSDDGAVFNAAYGHRWRSHFGRDQLLEVVGLLRRDPATRQAVLQIWDPADLTAETRDKACNMSAVFDCRGGALNMTVFNRSNDIWWGAYGANAVHFSVLQEWVAAAVGLPVGVYRQISNNLHLYLELYDARRYLETPPDPELYDRYETQGKRPRPLLAEGESPEQFLRDCERFCDNPFDTDRPYTSGFLREVAFPMAMVSRTRRAQSGSGRDWASRIEAEDWLEATHDWIDRREYQKSKVID